MTGLLHQVLAGLATGGVYASLALALVMVYRATHHLNFAQGAMATFSTFLAWTLLNAGLPLPLAFAGTVLLSFLLGVAVERVLLRPVAGAPALTPVGVTVGLLLILDALCGAVWDYTIKPFPSPFGSGALLGGALSRHEAGSLATVLGMLLLVWLFFRHTKLGLAMRAAAFDPMGSRLVGIDVSRMAALGWGLAAAIGALAGILIAPVVFLDPGMMTGTLLYAFAGALLGGLDSPAGAVLGGFLVGVMENLAGAYLVGSELKLTCALLLIGAVLMLRPTGLFGRRVAERA